MTKQDHIWENDAEYQEEMKLRNMTPADMLREFHDAMDVKRWGHIGMGDWYNVPSEFADDIELSTTLVEEEYEELFSSDTPENQVKELADLIYVLYGYADRFGIDLDEAVRRVHKSNMSKVDPTTGKPNRREDGKILKGPNYKVANMEGTYVAHRY